MAEDRRELTVKLAREGSKLARAYYFGEYGKLRDAPAAEWSAIGSDFRFGAHAGLEAIAALLDGGKSNELIEHFSQDKLANAGGILFQALFGERDTWEPVLRAVFDQLEGPAPTPIRRPVRLRIWTTEPLLLSMPWRATAWEGKRLVHERWTFEVTLEELASHGIVSLPAYCRLLVIAPKVTDPKLEDLHTDDHLQQLREALARVSAHYAEEASFRVVRTRAETKSALAHMQPDVVYYFGHGDVIANVTCLVLAGQAQPRDNLPMADFKQMMPVYPKVVFMNGCMTGASGWQSAGHQLTPQVPLVVSNRTTAWIRQTGPAAIAWLEACLGGGPRGEREPVVLLDRLSASESTRGFQWTTTIVHTGYRRWVAADVHRARRKRIGVGLDRWPQRNEAFARVSKLLQSPDRRVEAIVAYGGPGNLIVHAAEQLIGYMETIGTSLARIKHVVLRFPDQRTSLTANLGAQLRSALGIGPYDSLEGTLRAWAPLTDSAKIAPVLWIDWGTFGTGDQAPLTLDPDQIGPWIEFCAGELARECPPEIRVVSFLAMEIDTAEHDRLKAMFEQHQMDLGSAALNADLLPAFDRLRPIDLLEYLRDELRVPPDLARQITDLIIAKTNGRYEQTVQHLEEGLATTWLNLRNKLKA